MVLKKGKMHTYNKALSCSSNFFSYTVLPSHRSAFDKHTCIIIPTQLNTCISHTHRSLYTHTFPKKVFVPLLFSQVQYTSHNVTNFSGTTQPFLTFLFSSPNHWMPQKPSGGRVLFWFFSPMVSELNTQARQYFTTKPNPQYLEKPCNTNDT